MCMYNSDKLKPRDQIYKVFLTSSHYIELTFNSNLTLPAPLSPLTIILWLTFPSWRTSLVCASSAITNICGSVYENKMQKLYTNFDYNRIRNQEQKSMQINAQFFVLLFIDNIDVDMFSLECIWWSDIYCHFN